MSRISQTKIYEIDEVDPDDVPDTRMPRMVKCFNCHQVYGVRYPLIENAGDMGPQHDPCPRCRRLSSRGTSEFRRGVDDRYMQLGERVDGTHPDYDDEDDTLCECFECREERNGNCECGEALHDDGLCPDCD